MKLTIRSFSTDIELEAEEVKKLCKPGQGADTCVWLLLGVNGFSCSYLDKNMVLYDRWENGLTEAKRDGCDFVKNLDIQEIYSKGICEINMEDCDVSDS